MITLEAPATIDLPTHPPISAPTKAAGYLFISFSFTWAKGRCNFPLHISMSWAYVCPMTTSANGNIFHVTGHSLRIKDCQFDNFVVTGGTVSCRYDNIRCHQSRQSCQIDDLLFSVFVRGIQRSPVDSPHNGQWRGALMFSLICLNKHVGKQSWFETPSRSLWRHCNASRLTCSREFGRSATRWLSCWSSHRHNSWRLW